MKSEQTSPANGHVQFAPADVERPSETDVLRALCRRQARVIDRLGEAMSALRTGARALTRERRPACRELPDPQRPGLRRVDSGIAGDATEVRLALDPEAPRAARDIVGQCLRDGVAAPVLDNAQLIVSELVTNSLRHSGVTRDDGVGVRVQLTLGSVHLAVEDQGRHAEIAPAVPDLERGSGFGLNLVESLSQRWGVEPLAEGGTRVWAQLSRSAPV